MGSAGELFWRVILPSAPTGTVTEFGIVWPGTKFSLEVFGAVVPEAWAMMCP
ncbi:hypothetical protein AHiyo4_24600 [Arthrobacter sp. Hiyo4]|nr:hypothetical protein AHiyo4_24600 [Arthrobacter sp. Hiyo4]